MKKIITILAAALTLGSIGFAQANDEDSLSFKADLGYQSKWIFRGVQKAKDSLQSNVSLNYQTFNLGVWSQNSLRSSLKDTTKYRAYGSAGTNLSDSIYGSVGFNLFHAPHADYLGSKQTSFEPNVSFKFDLSESIYVSPTVLVAYDVDLKDWTFEAGVGHAINLDEDLNLELSAALGYRKLDSGTDYLYGVATANIVYAIKEPVSLYAGVSGSFNDLSKSVRGTASGSEFWFGAGLRAAF